VSRKIAVTEVRAVGHRFPCCGHPARFNRADVERETVTRRCHRCATKYEIHREKGRPDTRGRRLDFLTFKEQ
jgi:hypothetical protein